MPEMKRLLNSLKYRFQPDFTQPHRRQFRAQSDKNCHPPRLGTGRPSCS